MQYCNVYKHYSMLLWVEILVDILTIYIFNKLFYTISVYLQHESMDTDGPHEGGSCGDHMRMAVVGTNSG
jgi:hypothetical protein